MILEDNTKYCPLCLLTKSIDEFHKDRTSSDGLQYKCKPCRKKIDAEKWKKPEVREAHRRRQQSDKSKSYFRLYRKSNHCKEYEIYRKPAKLMYMKEYITRPNVIIRRKKYTETSKYRAKNRLAALYMNTKRSLRIPNWLTEKDNKIIKSIYESCPLGYVVDHIVPLCGKTVSGLHVPHNLCWLPKVYNLQKSNNINFDQTKMSPMPIKI